MSTKDNFLRIVKAHGFEGDLANLIADMFAFYAENYLTDVLGQYYNASVLKAANIDSLLQLALDLAYPVWRGTNLRIEFEVLEVGKPITFQPLQEVFSYGSHFFYYNGNETVYLTPTSSNVSRISLLYSSKPKRVLEYALNKNEITVIDDKEIISEHLAFYIIYEEKNIINMGYVPHERFPSKFWGFLSDANPEMTSAKDILVLTTPRHGIYAKFSDRIVRFDNTRKIRLEYLNWTSAAPPNEIFARLYSHLTDTLKLDLLRFSDMDEARSYFAIYSPTFPETEASIRDNLTEGTRFNGIIRSITDIKTWIHEEVINMVYDIRSYHFIDTNANVNALVPNIYYLILAIPRPGVSLADIKNIISNTVEQVWHTNYPRLNLTFIPINDSGIYQNMLNTTTNSTNLISPTHIIVTEPTPVKLLITYSIEGTNKDIVYIDLVEFTNQYIDRIIDVIDPREIFTYLARNANVEKIKIFNVEINYYTSIGLVEAFAFQYYVVNDINEMNQNIPHPSSTRIQLIQYDDFYQRLISENFDISNIDTSAYFKYIQEVSVVEINN